MKSSQLAMIVGCALLVLFGTVSKSSAAGKFSAPVQNTFTISFDDAAALTPGPTNFRTPGPNPGFEQLKDWDDSNAGEVASWGSFGGAPDEVFAGVVADAGPNGIGDNAARLYVPSKVGSFFTNLSWQVKGLQLGNSSGGTVLDTFTGLNLPVPNMDTGIQLTVPVKTDVLDAAFRINFDTGQSGSNVTTDAGSFVPGNVPGLIEQTSPGSRVLTFGATGIGVLPQGTWSTDLGIALNENPTDSLGWTNASFSPFNSRGPRSFQLTRVGVTFPGGGQVGEVLVGSYTMSGPDILKYHEADFNYDEMVDDQDIDMLFAALNALALNDSLPPVPDADENNKPDFVAVWGVNQVPNVTSTLAEKFSITKTDAIVLDFGDVDELVLNILGTEYGDLDLNGIKEASDRATLVANLNTSGGWADGDLNGDGIVDAADLAVFNGPGLAGDFDSDGDVDGRDFLVWQRNTSVGSLSDWQSNFGAPGPLAATQVVPEPGAFGMVLLCCGSLLVARRWQA